MHMQVWEVVAELVSITARPRPVNPFQIRFPHIENLETVHATLCAFVYIIGNACACQSIPHMSVCLCACPLAAASACGDGCRHGGAGAGMALDMEGMSRHAGAGIYTLLDIDIATVYAATALDMERG